MPPTCPVDGIYSLWVVNIDGELLQFGRRIFRNTGERRSGPQGCINLSIVHRVAVVIKSLGVSSHDLGRGRRGKRKSLYRNGGSYAK
jgi:hypothetical protein